jgi:hypothetical protein
MGLIEQFIKRQGIFNDPVPRLCPGNVQTAVIDVLLNGSGIVDRNISQYLALSEFSAKTGTESKVLQECQLSICITGKPVIL